MERIARLILTSLLALIVLSSACNLPVQTQPAPVGTVLSTVQFTSTPSPTNTLSNETSTAFIPITGLDVVSLQCQFCVNDEAHAVLIMSKLASFNVSDPVSGVTCLMAQDVNDRRIVLCRGARQASFNLNVCVGTSNCLQFPITLQPCPLIPQAGTAVVTFTPFAPVFLTPSPASRTPRPRESTPVPNPTNTSPAPPTETTAPTPQPTTGTSQPTPVPTQPTEETQPPSPLPTTPTESNK